MGYSPPIIAWRIKRGCASSPLYAYVYVSLYGDEGVSLGDDGGVSLEGDVPVRFYTQVSVMSESIMRGCLSSLLRSELACVMIFTRYFLPASNLAGT